MANRISKINPDLTLTLAHCANEAYFPDRHTPPSGYQYVDQWTGKNPTSFGGSVEVYGLIFQGNTAETAEEFIFAFRGTASFIDAYEDLFVNLVPFKPHNQANSSNSQINVENGFMSIYSAAVTDGGTDSMQNQLFDLLSRLKPKKLIITGHSLGSALAQLFTLDLYVSDPPFPLSIQHYNFASPRVGDARFAETYRNYESARPVENRTVRIVNYWDWVPCVPFESLGYKHGADYFLISFYKNSGWLPLPNVQLRHSVYNYWQVLKMAMKTPQQTFAGVVNGYQNAKLKSTIPKDSLTECNEALGKELTDIVDAIKSKA